MILGFAVSIEAKALVAALLISGSVVGGFLGTAHIIRYMSSVTGAGSAERSSASKNLTVAAGAKLFALNCARCHGADATGDEGPDLHGVTKTDKRIESTILNGVKGAMPAFGKRLTQNDAATLVVFIRSLTYK